MRFICITAAIGCAALATPATHAVTVTLNALKDNTIIENVDGEMSNGAGSHFFAGRTGQGLDADRRRGVIAFDIAGGVPSGALIEGVTLTLRMSRSQAAQKTVSLHRLLADWGEGPSNAAGNEGGGAASMPNDATWLHCFYPSTFWTTAGGDFEASAAASTNVSGIAFYSWSSGTMRQHVQGWLDSPATNFGWIVIGDEATSQTAKRFDSRQHLTSANRPKLEIVYSLPGACCFIDGSCAPVAAAACTSAGGTHQGTSTSCAPNACPLPTGACCFVDGACSFEEADDCAEIDGTYQGHGVACSIGLCPTPCPADIDGTGDVGFSDVTQLLIHWGACPPNCPWDLDGSGNVGFGDLTELLIDWGPCP